ncbi:hypothetical protein DY000_02063124 [Brassica cretica]|uniref:Uncharacterized protein n=1 Tax=Brassica cretica TaxID=69181 RepID=A0ABQ7AYM5_BRACR|nr:hypothetical protein DY000_02063124 [Brassica cretica]
MGNSITIKRKRAKVMKIDGEVFHIKTPATAREVTADYPGYVLLDSEAVKHFGVRSKPLEPSQLLKPKKTSDGGDGLGLGPGQTSVRFRLPRSQITKFMEESNDDSEIADKILSFYRESSGEIGGGNIHRKLGAGEIKAREKQVSFAGDGGRELPVLWSRAGNQSSSLG